MHIELKAATQERIDSLVREGAFPSAEAVIEAAVDALEHPDFGVMDVEAIEGNIRADIQAGRVHDVTPEFLADLRERITRRTGR